MTSPIAQGFPDYQRQRPAQNTDFGTFVQTLAAPVILGPFWVGYVPAVRIAVASTTKGLSCFCGFSSDQAGLVGVGQQGFTVRANGDMDVNFRSLGPWMGLHIAAASYPCDIIIRIQAQNAPGINLHSPTEGILCSAENNAIGIGAALSLFGNTTFPGPAYLNVNSNKVNWTVSLASLDFNDVRTPIFQITENINHGGSWPVYLPATPTRIIFTNNDAAAAVMSAYLVGMTSANQAG